MWLYRINRAAGPLLGLYWRLRLVGEKASIPRRGPLLVAANHSSFLDPWMIGMVFPRLIRYLIAGEWYDRSGLTRSLFAALGTIPLSSHDPIASMKRVFRYLEAGEVVGIFPEGSISHDGQMRRLQSGLARIAARSGAPVLPVGIRGAFESLPRTRSFPRPTPVEVHVGAPMVIRSDAATRRAGSDEIRRFNNDLLKRIATLAGKVSPPPHRRTGAGDGRA